VATVFFVFFDQRTVAAGETERRRLVFEVLEIKTPDQQRLKQGQHTNLTPTLIE
jgi:hypothetical protein